jgi:hypothetical protein
VRSLICYGKYGRALEVGWRVERTRPTGLLPTHSSSGEVPPLLQFGPFHRPGREDAVSPKKWYWRDY